MEYVIWGIPPQATEETILYTKATTKEQAVKIKGILESKHGCTAVRIQELDLSECPSEMWRNVVR